MSKLSQADLAIVLDVGGSSVKSALVARDRTVLGGPVTTAVDSDADAASIIDQFGQIVSQHLAATDGVVAGIAAAFPGPFDYEEGICRIDGLAKYAALYGRNVGAELRAILPQPLPTVFVNDAEAAICGEARYGAGRRYGKVIGVTLGTGIGSAFIINGVAQHEGVGVPANGWVYNAPYGDGIADETFSIRGLQQRLRAAGHECADIRTAAALAQEQSEVAAVFADWGRELGCFLTPFTEEFGAEALLVLGGIAGAYEHFGPALCEHVSVPVRLTTLGALAPLLGAAYLVFDHYPSDDIA